MFREMRRIRQQMPAEAAEEVLLRGQTGVLAVSGDDGYPYAVPVNYLYRDGKIIFHGAKAGHKYDAMRREPKASFCVIDHDEILPEEVTDLYRSVIVFGKVRILEDVEEMREAALALGRRFSPEHAVQADMQRSFANVCMYELVIEHMTGKESPHFAERRG